MDHSTVRPSATLIHVIMQAVTTWTKKIFALSSADKFVNPIDDLDFFKNMFY